jgi:hypothetical protein
MDHLTPGGEGMTGAQDPEVRGLPHFVARLHLTSKPTFRNK